jgi:hypothetical protein
MRSFVFLVTALLLAACSPSGRPAERNPAPADPGSPRGTLPAPATTPAVPPGGRSSPWAPSASPAAGERAHTVTLTVGGSARRATVTYTGPDGREKRSVVSPPWTRTFAVHDGQTLGVTAHSESGGSLSCAFRADGELLRSAMSSGDSATVDCGDSIGF